MFVMALRNLNDSGRYLERKYHLNLDTTVCLPGRFKFMLINTYVYLLLSIASYLKAHAIVHTMVITVEIYKEKVLVLVNHTFLL